MADVPRDNFDGAPGNPAEVQPTGDVIASDGPAPGQQVESAPQVFSAEQLAAAKAARPPAPEIILPSDDVAPAKVKRSKKARK